MTPQSLTCQVLVVGGGPGGYPAAIRAGQLGLDTVIVEAARMGGTCLIRGCIPSKAFIHAAGKVESMAKHTGETAAMGISLAEPPTEDMAGLVAWKDGVVDKLSGGVGGLLKAAKVKRIDGWAVFETAKTCRVETVDGPLSITAEHVILANGSTETELPFLPFDGETVISSTHALDLAAVPEDLVVVGAGYIGLELGIAFSKLGANVTFVEAGPALLPSYDAELTRPIAAWLKKHDVAVHLNAKAKGLVPANGAKAQLEYETAEGEVRALPADKVLVAVGRRPNTQNWGLETMGLEMDGAFIRVDDQCRTAMRGVYAIGDLVGEPMLAHKATAQGERVAEIIAGHRTAFDPVAIAAVCFTEPEIVGVGLSPDEAKAAGEDIVTGKFPFAASGRALAMEGGEDQGFVRITARASDHVVLGIHAVGAHVAELSGEFALAIEMGARLEDVAGSIHVHPTLTEAFAESALAALGHPIHIAAPRR
ncbi:MAG: dihydrolipoyl dehydrogenase [Maricaulaceae bacterium]